MPERERKTAMSNQLQVYLVHVAPAPVLVRLERLDDGMASRMKVFPGVLVLRVVAAAYVAARQAEAQVYPCVAHLQALFAAIPGGRHILNCFQMRASRCHSNLLSAHSHN